MDPNTFFKLNDDKIQIAFASDPSHPDRVLFDIDVKKKKNDSPRGG